MWHLFGSFPAMASDPQFTIAASPRELENARRLVREGHLAEAEQAFRGVLVNQPGQVEALRFLANAALARGAAGEAVELLNRAANVDRSDIGVLMELGVAYRAADRRDESRYVLERALQLSQGRNTTARLLLANVLELDRRDELALAHYFRAILEAQSQGQWLDDNSTEPGLRQLVRHAMRYVANGRRALFDAALQAARTSHPDASMRRIERALAIYLRESDERPPDPRQRPTFLYVPELGSAPFIESKPEWLPIFLERIAAAAMEVDACVANFSPVATNSASPFSLDSLLSRGNEHETPREQRLPIYQRGLLHDSPRKHAPRLLAALEEAPLVHIPRHGPDAEIILLPVGTRSPLRYGRTNSRCAVAVALPGSAPVQVIIGGESRALAAGEALIFDPGFGVEYANGGQHEARVLAFEIWHPDLSSAERAALHAITEAAVEFDSRLQEIG
jgi:aspartate beta-hydroxylase